MANFSQNHLSPHEKFIIFFPEINSHCLGTGKFAKQPRLLSINTENMILNLILMSQGIHCWIQPLDQCSTHTYICYALSLTHHTPSRNTFTASTTLTFTSSLSTSSSSSSYSLDYAVLYTTPCTSSPPPTTSQRTTHDNSSLSFSYFSHSSNTYTTVSSSPLSHIWHTLLQDSDYL